MRYFVSFSTFMCCLLFASSSLSQTIRVPGFQPGDGEKFHYFVVRFDKGGYLGNGAAVDQSGLLHVTIVDRGFVNGVEVHWEHLYIYAQDHVTGENLYSFDLVEFSLLGFVQSLAMSQRRIVPPGTPVPVREPISVEVADPLYADKVVASMQAENLSFEQTLDLLRHEADCDIVRTDDKLVIDWCR